MAPYLSGRFKGAEKVYRQARRKYGADKVQVTGHSLGGSQAHWEEVWGQGYCL